MTHLLAEVDVTRLERVLGNLVSNAIKYSPADSEIQVTLTEIDDVAVISVRDHGIGIPAADLPHVFDGFHRGANVTGRFGGTGLGLAGARRIVEQHGGRLAVDSQEGAGATFTLRLPLNVAEVPADEALSLLGHGL
jgi:signal transduction histidine kinase